MSSVFNLSRVRFSNEVSNLSYLIRWTILGVIIGSIAGGAAIAFALGVEFFATVFLGLGADFIPPSPSLVVSSLIANSPGGIITPDGSINNNSYAIVLQNFLSLENGGWWMIPLITGMGGKNANRHIHR